MRLQRFKFGNEKTAKTIGWLTMLFKFRRAILNLKKCIINYVTLKSAAAVTMRRVGCGQGGRFQTAFSVFFSYSKASWWEISMPIFHHSQANTVWL